MVYKRGGLPVGRELRAVFVVLVMLGLAPALQEPAAAQQPAPAASTRIQVKFREGTTVRLRRQAFVSLRSDDLRGVGATLGRYPGLRAERLFTQPETVLTTEQQQLRPRRRGRAADLNLYYRLSAPDAAAADALVAQLNALPIVEQATEEPVAPPPPPVTPSYVAQQQYRLAAPGGIDADHAATMPGARGEAVKVVDVEYGWNQNHEDLSGSAGALMANGTPCNPFDDHHGTAVLGQLGGDDNVFGVTGLVPRAGLGMVNAARSVDGLCLWDLANSINTARQRMSPGDILLIEQQTRGTGGQYVPVEWDMAVYDAIALAVADGIVVVEAAGNGNQNLDAAEYGPTFPAGRPDSGAIIVGAGNAPGCGPEPARSRASFSTYGSRVNLQGWGECVATSGYGGLGSPTSANDLYTSGFSGTSSASPIVAAAAAAVSSAHKQATGTTLTSPQVRARLVDTGTVQDRSAGALAGNIGPLPNLRAALGNPSTCTVTGTAGNDKLTGTPSGDVLCGLGGNDTFFGLGGNDTVLGGAGADALHGGAGNDALTGGAGTDRCNGGTGTDTATTCETRRFVP